MKLTRFSYSFKGLLLLICLGIQHGNSNAKAINKPKHGVNKSGSKKFNAPKGKFCKNHSYCVKYSDLDCASEWVQLNCPRMCRLCEYEGPNLLNLPAVLYYKKGDKKHGISGKTSHKTKHADKVKKIQRRSEDDGDRRDVVFLSKPYDYAPKPTTPMPTTSYTVFDYKGNYRNWLFLYPDQHPVNLRYVDQGKAKDSNQQTDQQQQSSDSQNAATAGAPVAAEAVAAPTVSPASPAAAQPVAPAFASPATAPGVGQPAMEAAQPWNGAQTAMTNQIQNKTIELINQSVSLASNETQQAGFKPIVPSAQGYDAENSSVPAEGNFTGQNVSESLNETQSFIVSQPNSSKTLSQAVLQDHSHSQETTQESPANEVELSQGESLILLPHIHSKSQSYSQEKQQSVAFELNSSKSLAQTEYADASYSRGTQQLEQELQPNEKPTAFTQNSSGDHSFALKAKEALAHASKLTPTLDEASQILSSKVSGVNLHALQTQTQSFAQSPEQLHQDGVSLEEQLKTSQPVISPPLSSFHSSHQEMAQSEHKLHVDNTDASSEMHGDFSPYGASVYLSGTGNMDFSTTGQVATQDTTSSADAPAQTPWTCCRKVPPPKDCKPCPKLPKAPHMPYVFNIYCDDIYKDCAYAYSNCNDTWWEINCPKTCGLCKTKDKVSTPTAKEIMPKEVKDLVNAELQSDLVAPIPGEKPLVAKYTLRVKPKLVNGVPQMQEIRIMPPNKSGVSAYVKPLMVLKQNITKPMIENIEIDVPKKGAKFSRKPSVEVIEGDHKETLQVHKGQAVVDDAMQRSNTKSEETQETKPKIEAKEDSPRQTPSPINTTTEQTAANYTTTEQTQSSSATTPYKGYTNQTLDAQTQSTTTTATADQSAASYQAYTQPQAASTASATEKTALSSTETCTDDNLCATYVESQCSEPWLVANCKSKCKLC